MDTEEARVTVSSRDDRGHGHDERGVDRALNRCLLQRSIEILRDLGLSREKSRVPPSLSDTSAHNWLRSAATTGCSVTFISSAAGSRTRGRADTFAASATRSMVFLSRRSEQRGLSDERNTANRLETFVRS